MVLPSIEKAYSDYMLNEIDSPRGYASIVLYSTCRQGINLRQDQMRPAQGVLHQGIAGSLFFQRLLSPPLV
jgi:hypothetical protein